MKTIKLSYLTLQELTELQLQTQFFEKAVEFNMSPSRTADTPGEDLINFYDSIIAIDISLKLWLAMRSRIEKPQPARGYTLNLRPSEAAVLFKICRAEMESFEAYRLNVIRKYRSILDQQLKSLS